MAYKCLAYSVPIAAQTRGRGLEFFREVDSYEFPFSPTKYLLWTEQDSNRQPLRMVCKIQAQYTHNSAINELQISTTIYQAAVGLRLLCIVKSSAIFFRYQNIQSWTLTLPRLQGYIARKRWLKILVKCWISWPGFDAVFRSQILLLNPQKIKYSMIFERNIKRTMLP